MIVPFAIFITDSARRIVGDRTSYYLVSSFDQLYNGKLSMLPSWNAWKADLAGMSDLCKEAFEGKANLHQYRGEIADIASTYERLKSEYEGKSNQPR